MHIALNVTVRPQALRASRKATPALMVPPFSGSLPCPTGNPSFSRNVTWQVTQATAERERTVDNVDRSYCDDFQCTSSPQVELTVKATARDLEKFRYTASLYQKDAEFSDGFRSVKGVEKLAKQRFYTDALTKPVATVHKLQMLDKGTAQIDWSVKGAFGALQVDIPVTTKISMNLLTGRIEKQTEAWDLSKLAPPAAMTLTANRVGWSAKLASSEATEKVQQKVSESLSSFDETDNSYYNKDPSDPTRFFQNNNNNEQQDYVSYAMVLALLYLAYKAYTELAQL